MKKKWSILILILLVLLLLIGLILFVRLIYSQNHPLDYNYTKTIDKWKKGLNTEQKFILVENYKKYDFQVIKQYSYSVSKHDLFVDLIIEIENISQAKNLVSNFSENEMKDIVIHYIPYRSSESFAAEVSEEGFFKLLQDERIVKVYYNVPVYAS
jgi:hypothetical protein